MDKLFGLKDRVAVITGGMGQLGVVYAAGLLERGCKIAILDTASQPKIKNAAFEKGWATGKIINFIANICQRDEVESALHEIERKFGIPDILINNAALDSPPHAPQSDVGPFETYPESSYDEVMAVNVKGTLICCQVVGADMAVKGKGSIINISSIYGILSPCQDIYDFRRRNGEVFFKPVAYSVSKSAILNLTRYLATYWARKGVRVNTVTPAGVFDNQHDEFLKAYCARVPMGRMADAGELLGAIIYLASDASSYMTGVNLVIDGGWSAW
jgi:NAD(P)-dependent dehydrogenase (short-subunit alcohol dehydrogenase family)